MEWPEIPLPEMGDISDLDGLPPDFAGNYFKLLLENKGQGGRGDAGIGSARVCVCVCNDSHSELHRNRSA